MGFPSRLNCGKSIENLLLPVTVQFIEPPRRRNNEQIVDVVLGTCPTVDPFFWTTTA